MKAHSTVSVLPSAALSAQDGLAVALGSARKVLEEQRALDSAMQAAGDPKHWYLRLGQLTTEELILRCERGMLVHPSWVLSLVALLHGRFLRNLRRWLSPSLGPVDLPWQSAFTALDLVSEAWSVGSVLTGLHLALRAQLEHDLPRAVAQKLLGEPVGDVARFRIDLSEMSQALRSAVERLLVETTEPHLPRRLARPGARLLAETLAYLLQRYVYDEVGQRCRAFERGVELAARARPPVAMSPPRPTAAPSSRSLPPPTKQVPPL